MAAGVKQSIQDSDYVQSFGACPVITLAMSLLFGRIVSLAYPDWISTISANRLYAKSRCYFFV
jgi:hypothetical protein